MEKTSSLCGDTLNTLRRISALALLALACTGCHYDSHVDVDEYRECNLAADLEVIFSGIPQFCEPLTLEDVFNVACQRNLNILVKELEYEIQQELVTRQRFSMLPDIKAHFENLIRNRNTASSSKSLVPGVPPAPLSISSQKHQWRWDYALVWNYVDFGLAFFRSRQEYNRAVKLQFEYQRLQQNLFVDITRQYWKAQTAKLARTKSKAILEKAKIQQAAVKKQLEAKIISEIQGLRSEGQLVTYQAQFQYYDKEYHTALSELALLMGLPPSVCFELADIVSYEVDAALDDICELEVLALYNRPELYSDDAEERIQRDEARAAVMQLFPGVDLFAGHNHDSNKYLLFNHWIQAGTRAAYSLLDWPRHYMESRAADGRVLLAKNNRVLMSVSVMTQVHLAYTVYLDNLETYKLSKSIEDINTRLLKAAQTEQRLGKLHEADVLKYEIELLGSQIDSLKQFGELQNALEQLNNALGLPLYYSNTHEYGTLEETLAPPAQPESTEEVEEEQKIDAEELRNLYLDYIIDKIEEEESKAANNRIENNHQERGSTGDVEADWGPDEEKKSGSEEPQHQGSAIEEKSDGEEPPANPSIEPEGNKPDERSADGPVAIVEDIAGKYLYLENEENLQEDESLNNILKKYTDSDTQLNNSHEGQDENIPAEGTKENFFIYSYHLIVDALSRLYAGAKSLL